MPSTKSERHGQRLTSPSRRGDIAELYAITWLWDNGYEVFHNTGCTGSVDMVGMKDGVIRLFDVKMKQPNQSIKGRSQAQKDLGVEFIMFNPIDRSLRIMKHRR